MSDENIQPRVRGPWEPAFPNYDSSAHGPGAPYTCAADCGLSKLEHAALTLAAGQGFQIQLGASGGGNYATWLRLVTQASCLLMACAEFQAMTLTELDKLAPHVFADENAARSALNAKLSPLTPEDALTLCLQWIAHKHQLAEYVAWLEAEGWSETLNLDELRRVVGESEANGDGKAGA